MAITLVQSRTAEASNYASATLAYNSNIASGNLLTCTGACWNGSSITAITVAATTGVADADTGAPAANDVIVNIFYK